MFRQITPAIRRRDTNFLRNWLIDNRFDVLGATVTFVASYSIHSLRSYHHRRRLALILGLDSKIHDKKEREENACGIQWDCKKEQSSINLTLINNGTKNTAIKRHRRLIFRWGRLSQKRQHIFQRLTFRWGSVWSKKQTQTQGRIRICKFNPPVQVQVAYLEVHRSRSWLPWYPSHLLLDFLQPRWSRIRKTHQSGNRRSQWDFRLHWRGVVDLENSEEKSVPLWYGHLGWNLSPFGVFEHLQVRERRNGQNRRHCGVDNQQICVVLFLVNFLRLHRWTIPD